VLYPNTLVLEGDFKLQQDLNITQNLKVSNSLNLNGYKLIVDGNLTTAAFYRDVANAQNCLSFQVTASDGNLTVSEVNTSTSTGLYTVTPSLLSAPT
jgi:hypothetical protein